MKYELLAFIFLFTVQIYLKTFESSKVNFVLIDDNESMLAITGSIFLRHCSESDLLLIPGIGDTLAKEIYRVRFQLSAFASLDGMDQALLHAKGIGDRNAKRFSRYLR